MELTRCTPLRPVRRRPGKTSKLPSIQCRTPHASRIRLERAGGERLEPLDEQQIPAKRWRYQEPQQRPSRQPFPQCGASLQSENHARDGEQRGNAGQPRRGQQYGGDQDHQAAAQNATPHREGTVPGRVRGQRGQSKQPKPISSSGKNW